MKKNIQSKNNSVLRRMFEHGYFLVPTFSDGRPVIKNIDSFVPQKDQYKIWQREYPGASYSLKLCAGLCAVKVVCANAHLSLPYNIYRAFADCFATENPLCFWSETKMFKNSNLAILTFPVQASESVMNSDIHSDRFICDDENINSILQASVQKEGFVNVFGSSELSKISKSQISVEGSINSVKDIEEMPLVTMARFAEFAWIFSDLHRRKIFCIKHSAGNCDVNKIKTMERGDMGSLFVENKLIPVRVLKAISGMSSKRLSSFLRSNNIVNLTTMQISKMEKKFSANGSLSEDETRALIELLSENEAARFTFCPDFHSVFYFMSECHGIPAKDVKFAAENREEPVTLRSSSEAKEKPVGNTADESQPLEAEEGDPWDGIAGSGNSTGVEDFEPVEFQTEVDWPDEFDD